jgi:hypothetical protein
MFQSINEEEEMSDAELMAEEEEDISGEEGIPRGINGIQMQNPPAPPAELLAKLKQQVSYIFVQSKKRQLFCLFGNE